MMYNQADNNDDSVLIRELVKGNQLAFNTLFRKYSAGLFRFAVGYLKSEDEAEEAVQEVFTIVWEKRKDLRAELSFKSYIFTITFNIIRKHFRTKALISEYSKSYPVENSDMGTSHKIYSDSLYKYIKELVNQLPERRKVIFIKSRFEGLSVKEIAEELNISHKTVENQLTDALRFIRTHLNRENM